MALQMKMMKVRTDYGLSNTGNLSFDNSKCNRLESEL
jgi:hypothetical protein